MKAVPTTPQEVRAVYRAILAAAKVFPSKNRAALIDEIRMEFRSCKDVTDEAEVIRLRRLALQSLEQLQSFTSNKSSQRDWSVSLKSPVA